ncbi:hypothetical protein IWX49DRAFT_91724 [Phyllosticta citricarpa]
MNGYWRRTWYRTRISLGLFVCCLDRANEGKCSCDDDGWKEKKRETNAAGASFVIIMQSHPHHTQSNNDLFVLVGEASSAEPTPADFGKPPTYPPIVQSVA